MKVDIQTHKFSLTAALRNHANLRMRFAFSGCEKHIQRVVMRLSDINGPRGGAHKCCHLQAVLAGLPDVLVEGIAADMYVAIHRATERTGRVVLRKVGPQQTLNRQGRPIHVTIIDPIL